MKPEVNNSQSIQTEIVYMNVRLIHFSVDRVMNENLLIKFFFLIFFFQCLNKLNKKTDSIEKNVLFVQYFFPLFLVEQCSGKLIFL